MKTLSFIALLFFSIILLPNPVKAQVANTIEDGSYIRIDNRIEFVDESKSREINVEITQENIDFYIRFRGRLSSGKMKVEIYDSKEKKQGSFSIGQENISSVRIKEDTRRRSGRTRESFSGSIMKKNPSKGSWRIKILPENANGEFTLDYSQKPTSKQSNK